MHIRAPGVHTRESEVEGGSLPIGLLITQFLWWEVIPLYAVLFVPAPRVT